MIKIINRLFVLFATMLISACQSEEAYAVGNDDNPLTMKILLTINGVTHSASLVDNSSTRQLVSQLEKADIIYEAHDYGGFEKVGNMGHPFPQNNEQITTSPGDLILYTGTDLCIYYGRNSWNFTRIGRLDNMSASEIRAFVNAGGGDVTVTLSLEHSTGISLTRVKKGIKMTKQIENGKLVIKEKYDTAGIAINR